MKQLPSGTMIRLEEIQMITFFADQFGHKKPAVILRGSSTTIEILPVDHNFLLGEFGWISPKQAVQEKETTKGTTK